MKIALALAAGAVLLASAPVSAANGPTTTNYYFKGNCQDCVPGDTPATATLTLADYTAGEALGDSNFVRLVYHSNIADFDSDLSGGFLTSVSNSLSGVLGATTGFYNVSYGQQVSLFGLFPVQSTSFATATDGAWSYNQDNTPFLPCDGGPCDLDHGNVGVWSLTPFATDAAVPEPATWGLMLFGFGGVGYALRRRAKASVRVRFA